MKLNETEFAKAIFDQLKPVPHSKTDEWRRFAGDCISKIKLQVDGRRLPTTQQLNATIRAAKQLERSLSVLPYDTREDLDANVMGDNLRLLTNACNKEKLKSKNEQRYSTRLRNEAASLSLELMARCGIRPVITRHSSYQLIAELLFEIATRKKANLQRRVLRY